jgi:hypothetical protein
LSKVDLSPHGTSEISAGERWELIERILNSRELKRSARLRELLSFLGKQVIHQGVTSLHEQEIGEAVFGRSNDYDTSLDNIVRVNATELRKRISQYYEGDGAGETLLVEIPRGAYVPVFSRRMLNPPEVQKSIPAAEDTSASSEPSAPAEAEPQAAPPQKHAHRFAWIAALSITLLAIGTAVLFWRQNVALRAQMYPWQADPAMRAFWSSFFESDGEVDIVTADTSLALAEDILKRPVSLDDYLDFKYKDLSALPGLTAETRATLETILSRNLGSVGDFRVAAEIMALNGRAESMRLANARAFTPENVKSNNVILIGGPVSNPWTALYLDRLDFYEVYDTVRHRPSFINRSPASGEQAVWELPNEPNRGMSIVAFVPNLSSHRYTLLIAGTDSQATLAGGEWLISGEGLTWISRKSVATGAFPYFEALLASSKLVGTPLRTEVIAYRIHPR